MSRFNDFFIRVKLLWFKEMNSSTVIYGITYYMWKCENVLCCSRRINSDRIFTDRQIMIDSANFDSSYVIPATDCRSLTNAWSTWFAGLQHRRFLDRIEQIVSRERLQRLLVILLVILPIFSSFEQSRITIVCDTCVLSIWILRKRLRN